LNWIENGRKMYNTFEDEDVFVAFLCKKYLFSSWELKLCLTNTIAVLRFKYIINNKIQFFFSDNKIWNSSETFPMLGLVIQYQKILVLQFRCVYGPWHIVYTFSFLLNQLLYNWKDNRILLLSVDWSRTRIKFVPWRVCRKNLISQNVIN
jgi:hypothetical protein